jgi:NAD(P)-dependent dehydrogenase (short-subunit alcohol dehydrogenase family)
MQDQPDGGCIINIGSVSGQRPSPGAAAYGAAKAGLANLTRTLAVEWAPKVRVNLVAGGMIRTEQSELYYGDDAGIAAAAGTVPLGRLAEPHDVGSVCVFLASPAAAYVSGAEITVHGGGERPAFLDAVASATGEGQRRDG